MGDTDVVAALRADLLERMGPQRYDLWFGASSRLQLTGGALRVYVPNGFFLQWLRSNFRGELVECCQRVLGAAPAIEFAVDPQLDSERPAQAGEANDGGHAEPATIPMPAAPPPANSAQESLAREKAANVADDNDAPWPINRRPLAALQQFVVGDSNRLAHGAVSLVARRPGGANPLFLHGPSSVGKTHLLEGVYRALRRNRNARLVYLTAEQFTGEFLEALHGGGLPSFRRRHRALNVLLLDDVQFFCGKKATVVELLHTIDAFVREGRQLVLAADRPPAELAELGPELLTRLSGGLICGLAAPEREVRLGILRRFAGEAEVELPEDVQDYVADHLTSHARELAGAVHLLKAHAEIGGQSVDLPLAREALAELIRHGARPVRLKDVERAVCESFGLEPAALHSKRRSPTVAHSRMMAMWLARKYTGAALSEIGHYFGGRSHSTVISAQKKVGAWLAAGQQVALPDGRLLAEDAVRKVEGKLRA